MTGRRGIALVVLGLLAVGLLLSVVLVPWGDDAPAGRAPALYHRGDPITVHGGDEFVIALSANPSTGYSWTAGADPDVVFLRSRQIAGVAEPGAPGTQELRFRAEHSGTTTLKLAYARSFEGGVPPAKTATFRVEVGQ
jgi:inhibitor of cysteine peptidase